MVPVVTITFITLGSNKIQSEDILVPSNTGPCGKWSLKRRESSRQGAAIWVIGGIRKAMRPKLLPCTKISHFTGEHIRAFIMSKHVTLKQDCNTGSTCAHEALHICSFVCTFYWNWIQLHRASNCIVSIPTTTEMPQPLWSTFGSQVNINWLWRHLVNDYAFKWFKFYHVIVSPATIRICSKLSTSMSCVLSVSLLLVTIWLEFCTSYLQLTYLLTYWHHHLHHP